MTPGTPQPEMPNSETPGELAEAWVSDVLDDFWTNRPAGVEPSAPVDRDRVAGLLFVHGLLTQMPFETVSNAESAGHVRAMRNVDQVMLRLNAPVSTVERPPVRAGRGMSNVRRRMLTCVMLTGLFVAAGLVFMPRYNTAEAAVERALQQAQSNQDREYAVVSRWGSGGRGDGKWGGREIRSTLFVRGQAFALRHPTLVGADLWLGSDGHDVWFVPALAVLPVLVGDKVELIERWQQQEQLGTPYLNVTGVLERLKSQYALTLLPDEVLPDAEGPEAGRRWRHVSGTVLKPSAVLAATIELWADPVTGHARRLVLTWNGASAGRVTFDLVGEPELQSAFYSHTAHHGHRRVLHVE